MQSLARFAIRHRWWVVCGWLAIILTAQATLAALGGADYRDELKLPHTETDTVSSLLKNSGQDDQNGVDGTMVVHVRSGTVATPPARIVIALKNVCRPGTSVLRIVSGWGAMTCATRGTLQPAAADPKLISRADPSIGLVNITSRRAAPTYSSRSTTFTTR